MEGSRWTHQGCEATPCTVVFAIEMQYMPTTVAVHPQQHTLCSGPPRLLPPAASAWQVVRGSSPQADRCWGLAEAGHAAGKLALTVAAVNTDSRRLLHRSDRVGVRWRQQAWNTPWECTAVCASGDEWNAHIKTCRLCLLSAHKRQWFLHSLHRYVFTRRVNAAAAWRRWVAALLPLRPVPIPARRPQRNSPARWGCRHAAG